jgi:hypothetical protein
MPRKDDGHDKGRVKVRGKRPTGYWIGGIVNC